MRELTQPDVAARQKSDATVPIARRLRKEMTATEREVWRLLREHAQTRWRKQAPIGPFIVDFVCHSARVVVEIDGRVHAVAKVALADAERQTWLDGRGYRVLRFTNAEVESDVGLVVRTMLIEAGHTPTPNPSPQGGGG